MKSKIKLNQNQAANHFLVKCIALTFIGISIVGILNWFDIFGTNRMITQVCVASVAVCSLIGCIVGYFNKFDKPWLKYFLMGIILCETFLISASLTFHAVILTAFPIVYATIFRDKKYMIFTFIGTAIVTIATVYVGYFHGVCDLNMIFLPVEIKDKTVDAMGNVTGTDFMLDGTWWKLLLYFAFPRLLILAAFVPVCLGITRIISSYNEKANHMEYMAKHDGMTGLYSKRYYLEQKEKTFHQKDKLGIMYLDINLLKYVNDTFGHDNGDFLISCVAEAIKSYASDSIMPYRVGGDEFVVVIDYPNEALISSMKNQIEYRLEKISETNPFPISVSIGFSIGKGSEYESILKEAETMMYKNKEEMHASRKK